MHDIRQIRQDSSDFDRQMKTRGLTPNSADILSIDSKKRSAVTELQTLQEKRNKISKPRRRLRFFEIFYVGNFGLTPFHFLKILVCTKYPHY